MTLLAEIASESRPAQTSRGALFGASGYLVLPRLFAFDEIAWVRDEVRVVALRRGQDGRAADGTIHGTHESEPTFRKLARHPRLLTIARDLLGGDVYIRHSRLVPRFGDSAFDTAWRRDVTAESGGGDLAALNGVTAAVILGDAGPQSAALHVAPGSHRASGLADADGESAAALSPPLGSVVFRHAQLAYSFNRPGERRAPPLFLISYGAVSHAAGDVAPTVAEADDCMWPTSWCAAG
jgi:ectoine hydroxylase